MNKIFLYLKLIFFICSFLFISYSIYENFEKILPIFSLTIFEIFYLILLVLILQNFASLRNFILIKKRGGKVLDFNKWSFIFFYTAMINELLFMSGHLFRSFELKKYSFTHREYIALQIFIRLLEIFLNFFILILIIIFFLKINFLIISLFLISIIFLYAFINLKINYLTKKILVSTQKFIKINLINHLLDINTYMNDFIEKKNIIKTSILTISILFINFFVFKVLFIHFVGHENVLIIFVYFFIYYLIKMLPFFNNIPGIIEIFFAFSMQFAGYSFIELLLFQIFLRFIGWVALLFSLTYFYIMQKYFKKLKNNNDI